MFYILFVYILFTILALYLVGKFCYHYGKSKAGIKEYMKGWQDHRRHVERTKQISSSDEWHFTEDRLN